VTIKQVYVFLVSVDVLTYTNYLFRDCYKMVKVFLEAAFIIM